MLVSQKTSNNRLFLDVARRKTRDLLRQHPKGLGIDEIREKIEKDIISPSHPAMWGNVVRHKDFVRNGDRPSFSTACHKRWICVWRLK